MCCMCFKSLFYSFFMYLFSPNGFSNIQPSPAVIHEAQSTINAIKERIEMFKEEESKLRKKIKKLSFKSQQLQLLIDKTLEERVQKPVVLGPLKPVIQTTTNIENIADKILQKLLLQSEPIKVQKYIDEEPLFEQLIFENSSIFDSKLQIALTHATPEIQIEFLTKMTARIKKINNFFTEVTDYLIDLSYEQPLLDRINSPNISEPAFLDFYQKQIQKIAAKLNYDTFKVVYTCSEGETLFFPDPKQSKFIDIDDSLSGYLVHQDNNDYIVSPMSSKSFEITCEAPIFEEKPVFAFPLHLNQLHVALGLLATERTVSAIEKQYITATLTFLKPLISLWRFSFLHASPYSYMKLAKAISNLREYENNNDDLFTNVAKEACNLCDATICRVLAVEGAEVDFPSLQILPAEPSLIRESYENNIVNAIRNPRSQSLFNRSADDEPTLSKITSMLVVPVRTLPVILAIYNPKFSNEFSNIFVGLSRLFAESLSPLLLQYKLRRQLAVAKKEQLLEMGSFPFSSEFINKFTKQINDDDFLEKVEKFLRMKISIFLRMDEDNYIDISTNELIDANECEITEPVIDDVDEKTKLFKLISFDKKIFIKAIYEIEEESTNFDNHVKCLQTFILMLMPYLQNRELKKFENILNNLSNPDDEKMTNILQTKIVSDKKSTRSASVAAAVCDDGTPIYVSSEKKLNDKEFEVMESYAEWRAYKECHKHEMERNDVLVASFIRIKATDVFDCDVHVLSDLLSYVSMTHSEGNFAPQRIFEMVNIFMIVPQWKPWFNDAERVIIGLLAVMYGCVDQWTMINDEKTEKYIKSLPFYCKKYASRILPMASNLDENSLLQIVSTISDYCPSKTTADECKIIAHLKLFSLDNYKPSVQGKVAIGRAIVYCSQSILCSLDPQASFEEINSKCNDEKQRQMLFSAEKVLIPMLTYLAQKNTSILKMLSNVREAMKLLRAK